jgi:Asp-tRNA(Asn)/Glu-tRNA(Gln) amidotransferase A subunit family amidase
VKDLHLLGAAQAARMIRDGAVTSVDLVQACLARVREVDGQVQAWTFLDPEYALAQARAADQSRLSGQPIGVLHGVPVGLKDIIDTSRATTSKRSAVFPRWSRA